MFLQNPAAARLASAAVRRALSPGSQLRSRRRDLIIHRNASDLASANSAFSDRDAVRYRAQFALAPIATSSDGGRTRGTPSVLYLNAEFGPNVMGASLQARLLHTTSLVQEAKPSSKVEETVNRLKEKTQKDKQAAVIQDEEEKKKKMMKEGEAPVAEPGSKKQSAAVAQDESKTVALPPKKTLWVRFKDEVMHYVSGFKLLYLDVKVSSKIIWKVLNGKTLSRRENKQLVRTVSDLFRLVPFSVFILVPFMEFLLPVALKLFPGMLPSTFATRSERDTKMRRTLKAKVAYAKFLQKTLDDMAPTSKKSRTSKSAQDFVEFYKGVKEHKVRPKNEDIVKFSKLFEDEITLDNMTRGQLVALCRLLELTPLGTNNFLKFQLEMKVRQLKTDDRVIQREGLDNLTVSELQSACKERGMRAIGMSEKAMKTQLSQWLDLSLNANIPESLLLLSRTLYLPENLPPEEQIAATISALPESAAKQTTATIGEREGKIRNVDRLEVIKEEQRKIEEEDKDEKVTKEAKNEKAKKAAEAATAISETILKEGQAKTPIEAHPAAAADEVAGGVPKLIVVAALPIEKADLTLVKDEELLVDKAPVMKDIAKEIEVPKADVPALTEKEAKKKEEAAEISTDDLSDLKSAIESLDKTNKTETEEIESLKKELQDYEEDLQELSDIKEQVARSDLNETKGAARLFSKVNKMLNKVDRLVDNLKGQEKALEDSMKEKESSTDEDEQQKLITIHELVEAVTRLQEMPDDSKLEQIAAVRTIGN
jgi:LETM1 and EF-hand domain-containing protein 1